jgi:hypothetical protein
MGRSISTYRRSAAAASANEEVAGSCESAQVAGHDDARRYKCCNGLLGGASSGTPFVRLPGGPIISKVRDRASVKGSGSTGEHLPTASIIEAAARELGKGFEVERRMSGATQGRAGKVPKPAADSRAAVSWKDVDNIDLDAPRNVLLTRWTAADETHHLVRDRGDHVESVCSLQ